MPTDRVNLMKFIILNLKFKTSAWKWPLRHGRLLSDAIL